MPKPAYDEGRSARGNLSERQDQFEGLIEAKICCFRQADHSKERTTDVREIQFDATPEKGRVSALLMRPEGATRVLVLGHGASSNMRTPMMQAIADALAIENIGTFRYNFPYSENKRSRNSKDVCTATIRSAIESAKKAAPDLPILAGGHSFSGRMTSTAAAESPLDDVSGLVFFSFPLHPAGEPDIKRAEHLSEVKIPMLFLSGTRDTLAELDLLEPVVKKLGKRATLHLVDTADHSFKILKRSRKSAEDVFAELARVTREWSEKIN
jgi:predicted alpha/beta-hydrolase family hydrolase